MAKFSIPKRVDLHPLILSDEWKDTYIILRLPNAQEIISFDNSTKKNLKIMEKDTEGVDGAKLIINSFVDYLSNLFIKGLVFDQDLNALADLKREDLKEFPLSILKSLMQIVNGEDNTQKKS